MAVIKSVCEGQVRKQGQILNVRAVRGLNPHRRRLKVVWLESEMFFVLAAGSSKLHFLLFTWLINLFCK